MFGPATHRVWHRNMVTPVSRHHPGMTHYSRALPDEAYLSHIAEGSIPIADQRQRKRRGAVSASARALDELTDDRPACGTQSCRPGAGPPGVNSVEGPKALA